METWRNPDDKLKSSQQFVNAGDIFGGLLLSHLCIEFSRWNKMMYTHMASSLGHHDRHYLTVSVATSPPPPHAPGCLAVLFT